MRLLLPSSLLLLLAIALVPAAAADRPHDNCTASADLLDTALVHVDVHRRCIGVMVYLKDARCSLWDNHLQVGPVTVHFPILNNGECETGVVVEITR